MCSFKLNGILFPAAKMNSRTDPIPLCIGKIGFPAVSNSKRLGRQHEPHNHHTCPVIYCVKSQETSQLQKLICSKGKPSSITFNSAV